MEDAAMQRSEARVIGGQSVSCIATAPKSQTDARDLVRRGVGKLRLCLLTLRGSGERERVKERKRLVHTLQTRYAVAFRKQATCLPEGEGGLRARRVVTGEVELDRMFAQFARGCLCGAQRCVTKPPGGSPAAAPLYYQYANTRIANSV